MTKGVSAKHQREDRLRLRRKRLQDAAGALEGAKSPPKAVPVPTKPKRAPARPGRLLPDGRTNDGLAGDRGRWCDFRARDRLAHAGRRRRVIDRDVFVRCVKKAKII